MGESRQLGLSSMPKLNVVKLKCIVYVEEFFNQIYISHTHHQVLLLALASLTLSSKLS